MPRETALKLQLLMDTFEQSTADMRQVVALEILKAYRCPCCAPWVLAEAISRGLQSEVLKATMAYYDAVDRGEEDTLHELRRAYRENIAPLLKGTPGEDGAVKVTGGYAATVEDADGRVVGHLVKAD